MDLTNVTNLLGDAELLKKWRVARLLAKEEVEGVAKCKLRLTQIDDPSMSMVFVLVGRERGMRVRSARLFHGSRLLSYKEVL
jgi:hypothetical protein